MSMTRTERTELGRLIRQRERVMKTAAAQRAAELRADFERQLAAEYQFDDDEVWIAATIAVKEVVRDADAAVAQRCRELGIPDKFRPCACYYFIGVNHRPNSSTRPN